jgi:hypothetical protein
MINPKLYQNKKLWEIRDKMKVIEKEYEGSIYIPEDDLEYMQLLIDEWREVAHMIQKESLYRIGLWKKHCTCYNG